MTESIKESTTSMEESEIVTALEKASDQATEEGAERLKRDVRTSSQLKETGKNLGNLRRDTFLEKKGSKIYYKLDAVNNYLQEISTSNKKIKEMLINDRKTIVTAVQIALYKTGYLPVGWIDGKRGPITRGAVAKFQNENGLQGQKNPGYLNVKTLNKLIEVTSKNGKNGDKKLVKEEAKKKTASSSQETVKTDNKSKLDTKGQSNKTKVAEKVPEKKSKKVDLAGKPVENKEKDLGDLTPNEILWKNINELEKKGNLIWEGITGNVGTFREWYNGGYKFEFYGKPGNIPSYINVLGEKYKYVTGKENLNGFGYETCDGGWSFRIGEYADGFFDFGTKYSYDGLREIGQFSETGDLKNGVRIETDGSRHKVENGNDVI